MLNKTNLVFVIYFLCLSFSMSALCLYVDENCPYAGSGIHTSNNNCLSFAHNFIMNGGGAYGANYNGPILSVKTGYGSVGDYINLYSDSNCSTLKEQVVFGSDKTCQNYDIFVDGNRYNSYKVC